MAENEAQAGTRVFNVYPSSKYPDCRSCGPHRYREPRWHTLDGHTITYQTCRFCGKLKYIEFRVINGRLSEVELDVIRTKDPEDPKQTNVVS